MEECFIAIIPPEPILAKLNKIMKEMSSSLSSYKALTFPPHITLVHRFRTGNYKEFIKQLKLYCQEKEYVKVELLEFGYFDPPPIIFIHTKSSKNLHLELLELTKDFRTHWIRESFLKGKFTKKQQEYILKYGSPYVKEYYNSHLTMAGPDVNHKKFKTLLKKGLPKIHESFPVKGIVVIKNKNDLWVVDKVIKFRNKL